MRRGVKQNQSNQNEEGAIPRPPVQGRYRQAPFNKLPLPWSLYSTVVFSPYTEPRAHPPPQRFPLGGGGSALEDGTPHASPGLANAFNQTVDVAAGQSPTANMIRPFLDHLTFSLLSLLPWSLFSTHFLPSSYYTADRLRKGARGPSQSRSP